MILGVRLRLREGRRLTLGVAPLSRAVFALLFGLSLYILLFGVLFEGEASVLRPDNALSWILVVVTAAGLLYEERWTFDGELRTAEGRFGLLFLARKSRLPFSELKEVRIERYRKGSGQEPATGATARSGPWRTIVRLALVAEDGRIIVLDTAGGLRAEELRRTAERIARTCGLPFRASARPSMDASDSSHPWLRD